MNFLDIEDACPEIEYTVIRRKPERCGTCYHSEVSNSGAKFPGCTCLLVQKLVKDMESPPGWMHSSQVNSGWGRCNRYVNWRTEQARLDAEKEKGAGI